MTGHLAVPGLGEAADVPATLSKRILVDVLRDSAGETESHVEIHENLRQLASCAMQLRLLKDRIIRAAQAAHAASVAEAERKHGNVAMIGGESAERARCRESQDHSQLPTAEEA